MIQSKNFQRNFIIILYDNILEKNLFFVPNELIILKTLFCIFFLEFFCDLILQYSDVDFAMAAKIWKSVKYIIYRKKYTQSKII